MSLVSRLVNDIAFRRKKIMIVGDALTDVWIHGCTESCQEHCVKFVEESVTVVPGGAANAHRCLERWTGLQCVLYGTPANFRHIKSRYVVGNEIVFRHDAEDNGHASDKSFDWSRESVLEWVPYCSGVLVSDYDKGFLTEDFIREVILLCKQKSVVCVVDAKRKPSLYDGAIIKCNEEFWVTKMCQAVTSVPAIVITRGQSTPLFWLARIEPAHRHTLSSLGTSAPPVKCVNHVGAGDCFAAHLTLALAYGFSMGDAVMLAHSAGRVYVQHPHNRPPVPEEIDRDLISWEPAKCAIM